VPDGGFESFAHLTTPNAPLYRQVMGAFVAAKRGFVVHLRPEDVHAALVSEHPELDATTVGDALTQLVEWGNLRADPDTSRVTTVEDFHRARFLYQMTPRGEAVERALETYDEQLGRRGALQAVALSDIAEWLRNLLALSEQPEPDPVRVGLLLRDLVGRCEELAGNAQAFMGSLQRTIDLYDADLETFQAYKDRLVDYLERFVRDLLVTGAEIAQLLGALEQAGIERLLALSARRDAEDAAPGGDGGRKFNGEDPREQAFAAGLAAWQERWLGLRRWFLSEPDRPSQAKLLRARARAAIPQLLAVVETLNERRSGRSDRAADFRTLARWFAQAPDDDALHRLWHVAFGLSPARHLSVDADTLAARTERPVSAATPWTHAPPLQISPRLRRTGSYERRGRPNRVRSRAEERRALEQLTARQVAETAAARARLHTGGPLRLSQLGELDPAAFGLFLTLLGDALGARRPGQREVVTTTADGSLRIRMAVLDGGGTAEIQTPGGVLRGPDHVVEITDLAPAADTAEASAA
jgi:uncharacterized protein (TIGR02677 family)